MKVFLGLLLLAAVSPARAQEGPLYPGLAVQPSVKGEAVQEADQASAKPTSRQRLRGLRFACYDGTQRTIRPRTSQETVGDLYERAVSFCRSGHCANFKCGVNDAEVLR